ncbi:MAG: NAD(P)/FAD-dependent oxidoreductase [Phycisphaerae bacterium]
MLPRETTWDAVIVGAGPAGALSALLLARRNWRVLLVEKSPWPREKVCGGCLNASALQTLRDLGLHHILQTGTRLTRFSLHTHNKHLHIPLPEGLAISRSQLDARLVTAAQSAGATFLPQTLAKLQPQNEDPEFRHLTLMHDAHSIPLRARTVIATDGIAGTLLHSEPWAEWQIARNAWFGVSTLLDTPNLAAPHTIGMHIGHGGYVGAVRLENNQTHLAAALDPAACRATGGPQKLIEQILTRPLPPTKFQGTPLLTRKRQHLAAHRILAVGDACGYVEPFTGEGIAWALRSAKAAVDLLPQLAHDWNPAFPALWQKRHNECVRTHWCHALRRLARWPAAASLAIPLGNALPAIARAIGHQVSGLPQLQGALT